MSPRPSENIWKLKHKQIMNKRSVLFTFDDQDSDMSV